MKKLLSIFTVFVAISVAQAQSVNQTEKAPKGSCHSLKTDAEKKCGSAAAVSLCPAAKASVAAAHTLEASHEHAGAVKDKKKKCSKKHCGAGCKCGKNKGEAGAQVCGGEKKAEGKGCCASKKAAEQTTESPVKQ
ncbi:MAG: hypothetical protein NZL95_04320 [Chitinophagales bacterium]|nr:hypothetical protein [Chitinophagales bacterium]MDW8427756.1 hypothetical protein [Chitinophagales bacterium]